MVRWLEGFHVWQSYANYAPDMESHTIRPSQQIPGLALRASRLSAPCLTSNYKRLVTLSGLVLLTLASTARNAACIFFSSSGRFT
jgi:hypothetical protein